MNSMKIGTYQMDTTFGLYLPEYTIPAPAVQTNFVKIIGRDGSVDLSNALGLHYDSRTWSLDFKCFDPTVNWHTLSSQVMNAIHGKRLNFEFDDDPNYFWTGRVSVQNYVSNHGTGTLKVTIVSDPFKYAKLSTIVTKTASTGTDYTGALVTFNTANAKINDLSVTMQPIQDLHGYSSPWPAGGGANLLAITLETKEIAGVTATVKSDGSVTLNGIATDIIYFVLNNNINTAALAGKIFKTNYLPGVNYRITSSSAYNALQDLAGNGTETTIADNGTNNRLVLRINNGTTLSNVEVSPRIGVDSTAVATWSPYSNICPISGHTGAKVTRTGKNLIIPSQFVQRRGYNNLSVSVSDNVISVTGYSASGRFACFNVPLEIGKTYTVRYSAQTGCQNAAVNFADEEPTAYNGGAGSTPVSAGTPVTFTASHTWAQFYIDMTADATITDLQFEVGNSASDFSPYQGETYSITFPTEAGTVYGGTLDVVTGVLTVDMASIDMGTLTYSVWNKNSSRDCYSVTIQDIRPRSDAGDNLPAISSIYVATNYNATWKPWQMSYTNQNQQVVFMTPHDEYADATAFKTAMSGVQLVYELATPLTYQLTPHEIEALVGTNNVWSDGGNVTVAVVTPETLTNNGRAVVPTLTASADMVLKWGNYSASVQQGTSTIPQLILENGANLVYIIGTGSISFTWQEASL